jgi:hypothetical protein
MPSIHMYRFSKLQFYKKGAYTRHFNHIHIPHTVEMGVKGLWNVQYHARCSDYDINYNF